MSEELKENNQTPVKLNTLIWLFSKQEDLRKNDSNRAYVILTASTIILAAYTFIIGRFWYFAFDYSYSQPLWDSINLLLNLPSVIGFVFILISIYHTINSFIHYKSTSREFIKDDTMIKRLFSHSGETIMAFNSFDNFYDSFCKTSERDLEKYLLADLWSIHNIHDRGFKLLKKGAKYLMVSIYFLFASLVITTALPYLVRLIFR